MAQQEAQVETQVEEVLVVDTIHVRELQENLLQRRQQESQVVKKVITTEIDVKETNQNQLNMDLLNQLQEVLDSTTDDAAKFEEKGNKAAGTRIRKAMQEIKKLAQETRVYISEQNKK